MEMNLYDAYCWINHGLIVFSDLMKNSKSFPMTGITTIPDGAYLPENYHFVIERIILVLCMASLLMVLQLIFQLHTNDDPPDIQNDLLGEDENNFNNLGNQIQNVATDTPKLCTSISRIDTSECLQKYLIDQRLV